jgi:hypothetical protein
LHLTTLVLTLRLSAPSTANANASYPVIIYPREYVLLRTGEAVMLLLRL